MCSVTPAGGCAQAPSRAAQRIDGVKLIAHRGELGSESGGSRLTRG